MRLISTIRRHIYSFSQHNNKPTKNVSKYLKTKKAEDAASTLDIETDPALKNAHYLLYMQFVPAALIALPIIYYLPDPSALNYLLSCNAMQYYASGLLCFNCFFTEGTSPPTQTTRKSICCYCWQSAQSTA